MAYGIKQWAAASALVLLLGGAGEAEPQLADAFLAAFGASGHLPALLLLWALCFVAMLLLGSRAAAPAGTRFDPAARQFLLPGSWVPMALIVGVFLIKYSVGVQLALEPTLARHLGFAITVTALYGLLSGLFAVRSLRVLRLAARPVLQAG